MLGKLEPGMDDFNKGRIHIDGNRYSISFSRAPLYLRDYPRKTLVRLARQGGISLGEGREGWWYLGHLSYEDNREQLLSILEEAESPLYYELLLGD